MSFQDSQIQLRFGGARRAGIERHRAVQRRVAEEERQPDRDLQCLPLPPVERELRERRDSGRGPRGSAARRGVGEQQIAAPADAHQLPAFDIHHVLVLVGDRFRAHLAAFAGGLRRRPVGADPGQHVVGAGRHRRHRLGDRHRQHAVAHQQRHRLEMRAGAAVSVDAGTGVHDVEMRVAARAPQHRVAPEPSRRCSAAPASDSPQPPQRSR